MLALILASACQADSAKDDQVQGSYDEELFVVTDQGRTRFEVELADSVKERQIGLMHRSVLPEDAGMLFIFDTDQEVSMWMKDTLIPLDMLFLDRKGKIVSFAENTEPFSTRNITSKVPVRAVLELNAGTMKRLGAKRGDRIEHRLFSQP